MLTTIMMYKFEHLSTQEIESMLGITLQRSRAYQEIKEEGKREATLNLVMRQLERRFGELTQELRAAILALPLPALKKLGEELLDFSSLGDLQVWLTESNTLNYSREQGTGNREQG